MGFSLWIPLFSRDPSEGSRLSGSFVINVLLLLCWSCLLVKMWRAALMFLIKHWWLRLNITSVLLHLWDAFETCFHIQSIELHEFRHISTLCALEEFHFYIYLRRSHWWKCLMAKTSGKHLCFIYFIFIIEANLLLYKIKCKYKI